MNSRIAPNRSDLYDVVLIDYPWHYWVWAESGRGAHDPSAHYDTMTHELNYTRLMKRLLPLCSDRVAIFAWVTNPFVAEFGALCKQWETDPDVALSFRSLAFTWVKLNKTKPGAFTAGMFPAASDMSLYWMGMGRYTRQNTESVWLLRRVKQVQLPRQNAGVHELVLTELDGIEDENVSQLVPAARAAHSEKPPEVHKRIEQLYGNVKRLELFARRQVPGWTCMGNEIDGLDIFDALTIEGQKIKGDLHDD